MHGGCNPLPLGGSGAVPHEVVNVVQQGLGLNEIRMAQQVYTPKRIQLCVCFTLRRMVSYNRS